MLHTKYQSMGHLVSDKKIFPFFPNISLSKISNPVWGEGRGGGGSGRGGNFWPKYYNLNLTKSPFFKFFFFFLPTCVYIKQVALMVAIFDAGSLIWTILVDVGN